MTRGRALFKGTAGADRAGGYVLVWMSSNLRADGASFRVLRDAGSVPEDARGAIVALGNFDGVHLGHQRLVATVREAAARSGRPSAILTFDPHPAAFFAPEQTRFRLTPDGAKFKILAALGLDLAYVLRFDSALARTSAAEFVSAIVGRRLGAAGLVVGPDFHFGRGREGTPEMLAHLAEREGLACTVAEPVQMDGAQISSSRIRSALAEGDAAAANRWLGYRWFVEGEVVHGAKRGRDLGYPTANVALDPGCGLRHGIYAVRVAIAPGEIRDGVASFGRRPTFDDGAPLLEINLLDFSGDLYDRRIECEFVAWIRGEERFESVDALIVRMDGDAAEARAALREPAGPVSRIG